VGMGWVWALKFNPHGSPANSWREAPPKFPSVCSRPRTPHLMRPWTCTSMVSQGLTHHLCHLLLLLRSARARASCAYLSAWRWRSTASRCDLHDGFQTLNTRVQRGNYNFPVFPRFVRKASSLSTSLPLCPSPSTDLSCGDPRAVHIVPIWSARSGMIPGSSRSCPRTLLGLSADIPSHGHGTMLRPLFSSLDAEGVPKWPFLLPHPSGSCPRSSGRPP